MPSLLEASVETSPQPETACITQKRKISCENQDVLVTDRHKLRIVLAPLFPDHNRDDIFLSKDFVAQEAKVVEFMIIDAD